MHRGCKGRTCRRNGEAFLMFRIGIYDRYLSTAGGGERYSCKMAEILSNEPDCQVELVTDLFADLKTVSERLNLDLSRVKLKVFPFLSEEYAEKITAGYDLFVNATYLSSLSSFAKKNMYLCYFPTPFDVDFGALHRLLLVFFRHPALWLYRFADRILKGHSDIEVMEGIYDIKRFMLGRGSWSSGKAVIIYRKGKGKDPEILKREIRLGLKNPVSSNQGVMNCEVTLKNEADGAVIFNSNFRIKRGKRHSIVIDAGSKENGGEVLVLEIKSDTFIPADSGAGLRDSRQLGIYIYDERRKGFARKVILKILGFVPLFLVTFPKDLGFLETYDRIISISEYSERWVKNFWNKKSTILYPPVDTDRFEVKTKEKIIISVGRFFPQHHNKKQYELAANFIELYEKNRKTMQGFRLVLAGGVENRPGHLEYVERIKKICEGYPVEVLTNVEWNVLMGLLSRSLIFWHASGMGEDGLRHPEKFEHFGITTVEAMASGCIPVAINNGGQPEIINDGKNGFLFDSWEEMKKITLGICSGSPDVMQISKNAVSRAQDFSSKNFKKKLLEIMGEEIGS